MERRGSLLLIEDENVLRGLVAQFLRGEGYEVCEAEDGGEGVRRFRENGPFDLLLVDLNLPVHGGVEVCRRVKQQSPTQKIMICSAAVIREDEDALKLIGVEHILTKPYHPLSLLAHIRLEVDSVRAARPNSPRLAPSAMG